MKKFIKHTFISVIIIVLSIVAYFTYQGYSRYKEVVSEVSIKDKVLSIQSNSSYISYEEIPDDFKNAIIAIEDHRFKTHNGIDIIGTTRAIVTNLYSRSLSQGGSTITQQLARNMYFTQEAKPDRKIAELFVALDLEKEYSKEDILTFYINIIYFGDGYYGLKEASLGYFNKEPIDLSLDEITLLAGIPNAPSIYALSNRPDLARERQKYVISAMKEYGYLDWTFWDGSKTFEAV